MEAIVAEEWQSRAAAQRAERRAYWLWTPVFIGVGVLAIVGGTMAPSPWLRWPGMACGAAIASWGVVYGTALYMRAVDEQERDANLWGCYVGMCVYLVLFLTRWLLVALGHSVPHADEGIFLLTMATVLGVFAWKRFR